MGDREDRFRLVFEGCYAPLWAYARRRATAADAEDLVAEVLTVAWRRLDDMPEGDGTLPWLYGVARRTLANQRRGQQRRTRLTARLASHDRRDRHDDDVEPAAIAALERLRPRDQEILRLAAWEQLTAAEIAVVLGCSPNAAALRLSRARRRLREALTGTSRSRTGDQRKVTDA